GGLAHRTGQAGVGHPGGKLLLAGCGAVSGGLARLAAASAATLAGGLVHRGDGTPRASTPRPRGRDYHHRHGHASTDAGGVPRARNPDERPGAQPLQQCVARLWRIGPPPRSEEHTSELQSRENLVCRLLLEKKKNTRKRK